MSRFQRTDNILGFTALTVLATAALSAAATPATATLPRTVSATANLGYSNVRATIRETQIGRGHEPMRRTLLLRSPTGRQMTVALRDSSDGNHGASLYQAGHRYIFLSRSDCMDVDPLAVSARSCRVEAPIEPANGRETDQRCLAREHPQGVLRHSGGGPRPLYLGRYDWMNGYDPPDGRFVFGFRYLDLGSASEGTSYCEWSRRPR